MHINATDLLQGLRHGPAEYFHPNGSKEEATYDEGYETGPSVVLFASGKREERSYVTGVLSGPAIIYGTSGDKFEFEYREDDGRRELPQSSISIRPNKSGQKWRESIF